jgi:pimeloyl-ACP methyl ester carboxylesterase
LRQEVRFCTAPDGARIAYAIHGRGPPLVRTPTWLTHLEFDWQSPVWRHWVEGLAEGHTVLRYDERGCGLSDRDVEDLSLDARVADLEAVIDAARLEDVALLGCRRAVRSRLPTLRATRSGLVASSCSPPTRGAG